MSSLRAGFLNGLRKMGAQKSSLDLSRKFLACNYSTSSYNEFPEIDNIDSDNIKNTERGRHGPGDVDPKRGWEFRGVHKAFLCGKVGEPPVQKILRDGHTVTILTVGTGGMFDQRIVGGSEVPRPIQWHRIAIHNETLGNYAVRQLVKDSPVFVEGDIETRVYNDGITGQIKNIPEITVRREGKIRLIKAGNGAANLSLDELREGLL
ncbi:Single-stranded DNA-binding protein [Rhynchospora pubera]|uniref:Single-stranded DNA-binding protein n=1 Tax=Rhynchospora pubera TaxID=906938 RepID=A0AAV8CFG6_9POAL|nr:Single-stranded DNA-binding protein [Rhynchospora pubera]